MKLFIAAVLIGLIPVLSLAADDGTGWVMTRLDLAVKVDNTTPGLEVAGTMVLRLETESSAGPALWLNSRVAAMQWQSVGGDDVADVLLNIEREEFPEQRFAEIQLQQSAVRGDELTLRFITTKAGDVSQLLSRTDISLASWVEAWYPVPSVDQEAGPPFTTRLISIPGTTSFDLPGDWTAITDGQLLSRKKQGDRTLEVWDLADHPVARSFAAGPFRCSEREVNGRMIRINLLRDHTMSVDALADLLGASLAAQEQRLGTFPFAGYGVVEVPDGMSGWSAASQQTFIMSQGDNFDHEHGNLPLWAHEMGHAWWGNTVNTCGPGEKMTSEALAQFSMLIALEALEGTEAMIEFLDFSRSGYSSRQCAQGYFAMIDQGNDHPLATLGTSDLSGIVTHNLADSKGMWFYHMLRREIGDDLFFATLRELINEFSGREMSLDDLRQAYLAAVPDHDLESFFAQWLDRTGAPRIDVSWSMVGDDQDRIVLDQSPDAPPFELDLDVAISGADGSITRKTIHVSGTSTTVMQTVSANVTDILIDPERNILMWRPTYSTGPMIDGVALSPTAPWLDHATYAGKYYVGKYDIEIEIFGNPDGLFLDAAGDLRQLYPCQPGQFKALDASVEFTVVEARATEFVATMKGGAVLEGVRSE